MEKWISVDERLPDKSGSYIICTDRNAVCVEHYYLNDTPKRSYFSGAAGKRAKYWRRLPDPPTKEERIEIVEMNIFDKEEIHENCTVQILTNTMTGDVSIGWWENDD